MTDDNVKLIIKVHQLIQSRTNLKLFFTKESHDLELANALHRSTIGHLMEQNKADQDSCENIQEIVHSIQSQLLKEGQCRKYIPKVYS